MTAHDGSTARTPPDRTGAVIVVLNLPVPEDRRVWVEAQALRTSGLDVTVVCPAMRGHRPGQRTMGGISVHYFPMIEGAGMVTTVAEGVWTTSVASVLAARLLSRRTRLLQVCNPPDSLAPLLRLARRRGARTVYDQHDCVPMLARAKISVAGVVRAFDAMERSTVRMADVILTPSEAQRVRIQAMYGRDATVVRTAPLGAPDAPTPHGAAPRPLKLGYLGVMGAQDGVEDLVQAIRGARASSSAAFTVSVGGDGPVLPAVKALVRELGLEDVVEFVGWLDDPAVRAFLADIDVMLVPDPPTDFNHLCAMNKVTHAMAAGKPVVYRPLRENMAVTGGAGYLASGESIEDFSTAIVRAIEATEAARHQVGQDLQRHFLANHTWAMHCERYLDAVLDRAPSLRE